MDSLNTREELIDLKLKKLAALEKQHKYRSELPHLYGNKMYKWQRDYCNAKFTHRKRFICAANQIGKVQPDFEWINTINGYKRLKDIFVGDYVFGSDGKPTKVLHIFPHKEWEFYKIIFHDGSHTFCGLEHLWKIKNGDNYSVKDTEWIKNSLDNGFNVEIDYCKPIEYPVVAQGVFNDRLLSYYTSAKLDLLCKNEKRIPDDIIRGSIETRIGYIQGLSDRKGTCNSSKGGVGIVVAHDEHGAIDDIIKLVTSLGGWVKKQSMGLLYGCDTMNLFNSYREKHLLKNHRDKHGSDYKVKKFKKIEYWGNHSGRCIMVDNEDKTYLTSIYNIVTHNSSIQIRDRIDVATRPDIWPSLWPILKTNTSAVPYSWYMYPNQDTIMQEFETKWIKELLPRGSMEKHPVYGWHAYIVARVLKFIHFNTNYRIYFKTYNQNASDLQSGSVFAIDLDEEVNEDLLPELEARMFATDGLMSMAFTATTGQDIWRRTIECVGQPDEMFPNAWKRQVSMYDCLEYEDGTDTPWTKQRIELVKQSCKNDIEIARRVYGKFVLDAGLKYTGFDRKKNFKPFPIVNGKRFIGIPKGWDTVVAVDYGSGGDAHKSAIAFLSYNKDYTKIRARVKKFDNFGDMTAGDLYKEYKKMEAELGVNPVKKRYDGAAKDFGTIATRAGDCFGRANKSHDIGELALNTALKLGILVIYDDDEGEGAKACIEFETLTSSTAKRIAEDHIIDAIRYAVVEIPIDWKELLGQETPLAKLTKKLKEGTEEKERPNDNRIMSERDEEENEQHYDGEFKYWNQQLDEYL